MIRSIGRGGATVALGALVAALAASPAHGLANRCATAPPERSPTWVDGAGSHWFDEHGLWTKGPDGSVFGSGGADADSRSIQGDPLADHAVQAYVAPDRQCVVAGDVGAGASGAGEFPMDARLLGGVRVLYGPSDGYGTFLSDGSEAPWVEELARPYPLWAGGTITSIAYDFDARRLVARFALDGSGPTEIYVPRRLYPVGVAATTSTGERLAWDADAQRVVVPPGVGDLTVTVAPATG